MPSPASQNLANSNARSLRQEKTGKDNAGKSPDGGNTADAAVPRMVRDRPIAWLLLVTGAIAWLASGALVLEKLQVLIDPNHATVCDVNPWVSCGSVMKTPQSSVFGFPNMFIGIVAFAVIITTAMAIFAGAKFARWYWIGLQTGVTLGFIFIVWLWSQALYVIHILCPFCMVVWACMIPLFVFVTIRNVVHGVIPAPTRLAKILGESGWIISALLYVAVIASIFFAFINVFIGTSGY
ncbi:vitamin K epoxide reductase family protein [Arthrobacter sp. MI7-26]|uniref:vitamin K epoxide reductase family protein n=1 Tax=Arthrobacter sp. MI7-26 TaxID=2993653 RepID=UPI0022491470|nr:vitamin K epoxide reductase family protein [Arthrobacter sp. MI7-26]MCX2748656.1 vitamin K epoxide reductase family protein [Arthrobacter sp. MI7-26]